MWNILNNNVIDESFRMYSSNELTSNGFVYDKNDIIPNINNIIDISSGNYHNLALRSDNRVYSWVIIITCN